MGKIPSQGGGIVRNARKGERIQAPSLEDGVEQKGGRDEEHRPDAMGPSPVLGQDGQNDEEPEVGRQLILLVKNQVAIGKKKYGVKEFLPDRFGIHVRPDGKHQGKGNVNDHVQVGRDEKVMGKQVQADQGKYHAPDKVSLPARHQFVSFPKTKQSTNPPTNHSDIEMHDRQTPAKRRVGSHDRSDPSFPESPGT